MAARLRSISATSTTSPTRRCLRWLRHRGFLLRRRDRGCLLWLACMGPVRRLHPVWCSQLPDQPGAGRRPRPRRPDRGQRHGADVLVSQDGSAQPWSSCRCFLDRLLVGDSRLRAHGHWLPCPVPEIGDIAWAFRSIGLSIEGIWRGSESASRACARHVGVSRKPIGRALHAGSKSWSLLQPNAPLM